MDEVTQEQIDAEVARLGLDGEKVSTVVEGRAYVDGEYVDAASGSTMTTSNPATGKVVARVARCDRADVDAAVAVARRAFDGGSWSGAAPDERKRVLLRLADIVERRALELAVLDAVEAGKVVTDNLEGDLPDAVKCLRYHAEAVDKVYDHVAPTSSSALGLIVREPVGVCGLIVPWNFPLLMAVWKLAPALATGNCVVLKPAEATSLSALRLAALATEAGLPPGVLNVVPGLGVEAGAAVASHPNVDMVGFTGSTVTGRSVLRAASDSNLKRVSLELGGKSPQIVFADADLDKAIGHVMGAAFWNQSENCSCGSRLIVHKSVKKDLLQRIKDNIATDDWLVGDPLKLTSRVGSMISPQHCAKVLDYIETAKKDGAECVVGGGRVVPPDSATEGGDFVGLTVFDGVTNDMRIAREEVFGPVLSVLEFDTESEAVALANDTSYGLAASVYTTNVHRAIRVSRRIRAGNVSVNCYSEGDDTTPFGGYKQSGFVGRDKSVFAHDQYQEMKTIWCQIDEDESVKEEEKV